MLNKISKDHTERNFILIASVLFALIFTIEKINGRFWLNDFKVFYLAAKALINNQQVYGIAFGLETGFYKYSPFTLFLFTPLTILPFPSASIVDFTINSFCSIATILILVKIVTHYLIPSVKINLWILLGLLLCVINHLVRELHLGNTNMILLLLLSLSLKFCLESKNILSGILLAIVVLTKPYFIICLIPFLVYKKWKIILNFSVSILILIISSIIFPGYSKGLELYSEWFKAMKDHNSYLSSTHTISALLNNYFGIPISSEYGIIFLGILSILLAGFFIIKDKKQIFAMSTNQENDKSFILLYFLLISIVPSILVTDTEHFLFSLPLITILVLKLGNGKNYLWISLFIILMLLYGGNSSDLLGKNLAARFEKFGLLGISNLILIGSVLYLSSKKNSFLQSKIPEGRNNIY